LERPRLLLEGAAEGINYKFSSLLFVRTGGEGFVESILDAEAFSYRFIKCFLSIHAGVADDGAPTLCIN
jgi:hypothetical protein